jgi:predicted short-subunit dehydrogenase-like oxidoreductase (DUF2520 family)
LHDDVSHVSFCVVGPGRLGSALLASLKAADLTVTGVVDRTPAPAPGDGSTEAGDVARLSLADAATRADLFWLSVPDDAIATAARELAGLIPGDRAAQVVAVHSSGLGSVALLDDLAALGVRTLCLHPLQSFAGGGSAGRADDVAGTPAGEALKGVPFAVTARDEATRAFGAALVERLGGRPFSLGDDVKPLYHLAAAVASNLLVALESEAAGLMAAATGRRHDDAASLLAPLVATTAANVGAHGAAAALTGPVARGDVGTVRAHLELLERRAPAFAATYRALSLQALHLAAPRLDDEAVRTLKRLLTPVDAPR